MLNLWRFLLGISVIYNQNQLKMGNFPWKFPWDDGVMGPCRQEYTILFASLSAPLWPRALHGLQSLGARRLQSDAAARHSALRSAGWRRAWRGEFTRPGELTFCYGKSPFFMGKSTINGKITIFHGKIHYKWPCSIAICMFTRG